MTETPASADTGAVDLFALAAARDAAARAYEEASAICARLEARLPPDEASTERLLCAQDRVIAARDRHDAAVDRYQAARDRLASARDRQVAADYLRNTYRDELTGALQRRAGRYELAHEVDRARRDGGPLVIAFLDVDGLKAVNDNHGHLAGDLVLRSAGNALLNGLRSYDVVVRFGGDEFVCALPGTSAAEAAQRLEDVCRALETSCPGASMSAGLAELGDGDSLDDLIQRADEELYARRAVIRGGEPPSQGRPVIDLTEALAYQRPDQQTG
jgi:diguanylate cyclase (GGDEF)-like protein